MAKKQKFPHLLGSKWTACQKTFGWRHFQVVNRKNQGAWVYAELVSSCDRSVRFWVNAKTLKDRSQWHPGWTPLNELAIVDEAERLDDGTLQILPESKDREDPEDPEPKDRGDGGDGADPAPSKAAAAPKSSDP